MNKCEKEVRVLLATYFNDKSKIDLWLNTENPLLGDIKPTHMIKVGRGEKLIDFIKSRLEGLCP